MMSDSTTSAERSETAKEQSSLDSDSKDLSKNFYVVYNLKSNIHNLSNLYPENDDKSADKENSEQCLSVVMTNLNDELENEVRSFLLGKLAEKTDWINKGKYGVLNSRQSLGCYYHYITSSSIKEKDLHGKIPSCEDVTSEHDYIVCLLGPDDGTLESFSSEIMKFCDSLQDSLHSGANEIQKKLECWQAWTIQFISQCILLLKSDISVLLHLALCDGKLEIICDDTEVRWDLERFLETCSLTTVLPISSPGGHNSPVTTSMLGDNEQWEGVGRAKDVVIATVENGKVTFSPSVNCSIHSQRWSEILLTKGLENYLALKKTIDDFKLRTIQDLNTLKRLLKRAENDHYSLYKAYQFLTKSGYEEILLKKAKQEALLTNSLESCELILLLKEYARINLS